MATVTVRNGVNVDQLAGTIEAIKADPELAQMTFRAGVNWEEGTRSKAAIGTFMHKGAEDTPGIRGSFS